MQPEPKRSVPAAASRVAVKKATKKAQDRPAADQRLLFFLLGSPKISADIMDVLALKALQLTTLEN